MTTLGGSERAALAERVEIADAMRCRMKGRWDALEVVVMIAAGPGHCEFMLSGGGAEMCDGISED